MASSDSHVTIVPYFTVPEGKMDAFKAGFADFYKHTKEGTGASGECLYYGFAQEGNKIFCREGYKSAAGVLAHLGEVKAELDKAVSIVGDQCIHRCTGKYCRGLCGSDAANPSGGSAAGMLARCKLPKGHEGPHECTINLGYAQKRRQINITVKKYSIAKRQRTDSDVASTNVDM